MSDLAIPTKIIQHNLIDGGVGEEREKQINVVMGKMRRQNMLDSSDLNFKDFHDMVICKLQ